MKIKGAPRVDGLVFRRFAGKSDFVKMSSVSQKSWRADGFDWIQTEEDIANSYHGNKNRDPSKEILIVEVDGEVVGFGEHSVDHSLDGTLVLWNSVHLLAEWRGKGIREAVFAFNERELLKTAKGSALPGCFQAWANDAPNDWKSLVVANGYRPAWHVLEMVRSDLDNIPEFDLPTGLVVRPVGPGDYRQLWNGMKEACKQEPWLTSSSFDDAHYDQWIKSTSFSPELWQAAWDGDKLVGIVQNYVRKEENEAFGRKWGHTERIFVASPWQRKGVARALISRSLKLLRDIGMQAATLDVVAENVSGALNLYRSLGYKSANGFTFYRKPIPE